MSWLKKVVPMLAPIITAMACLKLRELALINTITRIITADDKPRRIVNPTPKVIERQRFLVYLKIMVLESLVMA